MVRRNLVIVTLVWLNACLVTGSASFKSAQADPADVMKSHYAYYDSSVPLAQRQAEFAKRALPSYLSPVPRIDCPLYVMEYHIWWRSPFGLEGRPGYAHWNTLDDTDTAHGVTPWMRHSRLVGYPVAGLYNSMDEGVIRWQLQCMRNAGIDGVFVQLFPEWNHGEDFIADGLWRRVLKIAGEVGIKVAVHDEVQFRRGSVAQSPDVMERRAGEFLKKYGNDPAYLKIKGKPAYAFQYWDHVNDKIGNKRLFELFKNANQIAGQPVFWIPFHEPDPELYGNENVPAGVLSANSLFIRDVSDFYPSDESLPWARFEGWLNAYHQMHEQFPDKYLGLWGYAGFNNSPETRGSGTFGWFPRRGGRTLVELLRRYVKEDPSFIQLSSWNDWEENTALEPGLRFDGYEGDPYLYCRIIAATKGKQFIPPTLPPKESVDPWLWQTLYGIKSTPPVVEAKIGSTGSNIAVSVEGSSVRPKSVFVVQQPDFACNLAPDAVHGVPLAADKPSTFAIPDNALSSAQKQLYIGIEYSATAKGTIEITYSSKHKYIQYDPEFDEVRGLVMAAIRVDGVQPRNVAVRLLRDFDYSLSPRQISLTWRPTDQQSDDSPPAIFHIDLLGDLSKAERIGAQNATGMRQTFTISPSSEALQHGVVYLYGDDGVGNESSPLGVALFH